MGDPTAPTRPAAAAPCVVVTRPLAQARRAAAELQAEGLATVVLPLLAIEPDPDAPPRLAQAWATLAGRRFVMFVSAAAVEAFFDGAGRTPWPAGVRAGSTGPGTTAALRRAGVPPEQIDEPPADAPRFDSEALWQVIAPRPWRDASALVVRGEGGRDWLADTLRAAGAVVDALDLYRRGLPAWSDEEWAHLARAAAEPRRHWWQLTSSLAIAHLQQLAAARGLALPWAQMQAVASHPRIAESARAAGFGTVREAPPGAAALRAALGAHAPG